MEATLPRDATQLHDEPPTETPVDAVDTPETVARDTSDRAADGVRPPAGTTPSAPLRKAFGRFMLSAGKHLATLGIALVAVVISVATWQHYVTAPWTRNGSVRVQVANVAPQVAGKIVELRVADN
jgi:multidrug efflux pump subunit AcrA (membrane-fusion protein)